ncbi:ABC transporter substrate-binding protein [Aestuariivirga sp.]|uniref:ABC transporter substrate-binding protein n=1 Tax=Aestuariivirga sp. TaxID=2650926 RepID=UPI003BAB3712
MLAKTYITAALLLHCVSGVAWAEGFDTNGIKVNQELAARVPMKIREAGVLVGGSDNAYAPWSYLAGEDGQTPEGIDVDIGDAIAAKWGLKYESRTAPFDSILPALGSKYDIGINAFSVTNERMKVVNFVTYFVSTSLWAVKSGNPTGFDPENICGTNLALQTGTWHEEQVTLINNECVAAGKPAITILPFGLQTEALTRVAAGGADATISGDSQIALAVKNSEGTLETMKAFGVMGESGVNGIPVPKDDMELTQLVADTLNDLIADGTYAKLMAAWGLTVTIDKAEINPKVAY